MPHGSHSALPVHLGMACVAVCWKFDFAIDREDRCACDALSRQVSFPSEELGVELVLERQEELMHLCTPSNNPVDDVEYAVHPYRLPVHPLIVHVHHYALPSNDVSPCIPANVLSGMMSSSVIGY